MLKFVFSILIGLMLTITTATAKPLWKDQTRFDRLKNQRQEASLQSDLKKPAVAKSKEDKALKKQSQVHMSQTDNDKNNKDI